MFLLGVGLGSIYGSHNILNPLLQTMETNKSMSQNHIIPNPYPENVFGGVDISQP
jgi:hypothetical protein